MLRRLISLLMVLSIALFVSASAPALAQTSETDPETVEEGEETTQGDDGVVGEGDEAENPGAGGGEGQEPETETGAGEGETVEAEEEAGPIWTYQMSKIGLVLLFLMLLAIGGAYWNFVAKRQKQGI